MRLSMKQKGENCFKLANILRQVPNESHDQGRWSGLSDTACGTTACAMGWAAASGQFKGLTDMFTAANPLSRPGYEYVRETLRMNNHTPHGCMLNGEYVGYEVAGASLFGRIVHDKVFFNMTRSKERTIAALEFFGGLYMHGDRKKLNDMQFIAQALHNIDYDRPPIDSPD